METFILLLVLLSQFILIYNVAKIGNGKESIPDEFGERLDKMISQVTKFIP